MHLLRFSLAVILSTWTSAVTAQCSGSEAIDKVRIVGLLEIHPTPDCDKNEELGTYGLSLALAAEYIIDLVNNGDSDVAVPGVQYEFQLEDICRNRSLATKKSAATIPETVWTYQNVCLSQSPVGNGQESLLLGFLGPAYSSNAKYVAEFLNNTDIPVITPAATLAEFSDKTRYHSLLRTATSDEKQSKAMIDAALKLEWSFVLLLHTDDNYGRQGAEAIKAYGEANGICLSDVIEVQLDPSDRLTHYEDLARKIKMSQATGILYFGHEQQVIAVIENYLYLTKDSSMNQKVILASESVGTYSGVLNVMEANDGKLGLITLSPYNKPNNLESYIQQRIVGTTSGIPETTYLIEQFRNQCSGKFRCTTDKLLKASDATQPTINAAVALMLAFKQAQKTFCKASVGVCHELSKSHEFYFAMRKLLFGRTLKANISEENIAVMFDDLGELDKDTPDPAFVLNVATKSDDRWLYTEVGFYSHNGTWVYNDENYLVPNYGSRCSTNCTVCQKERAPYIYRRSENPHFIIAGTGIVDDGVNQHNCGDDVRLHGFAMMEAFYYTAELIGNITGIQFSTLFINTCRAKLATHVIMNQIFREEHAAYLKDSSGKEWRVRPTDFVVFLTGSSSGVSLALQTYLNLYNIPQISYKSTSVWLSDSLRYPMFLRNVASDEEQARLMIEIVKQNGWNNIGLIYSDSVYGQTGGTLVVKYANESDICISFLKKLKRNSDEAISDLVQDIRKAAGENHLPRVIIIFAEDGLIKSVLQDIQLADSEWKERGNILIGSETWSTLPQVIEGVEEFVFGSLTFSFSDSIYSWTVNGINYFQQYLDSQNPENNADNYLFIRFWQQYFDCYLLQDPLSDKEHKCEHPLSLAYTKSVSQRLGYEDIPSKHLVMAGLSVAYALFEAINVNENCTRTAREVDCSALFNTSTGRTYFLQLIQQTKIPQQANSDFKTYVPFLPSGDGKANYDIYSVFKNEDATASYQLVYEITDGKIAQSQPLKFYIDGERDDQVSSMCKTRCDCVNFDEESSSTVYVHSSTPSVNEIPSSLKQVVPLQAVTIAILLLTAFSVCIYALRKEHIKIKHDTEADGTDFSDKNRPWRSSNDVLFQGNAARQNSLPEQSCHSITQQPQRQVDIGTQSDPENTSVSSSSSQETDPSLTFGCLTCTPPET